MGQAMKKLWFICFAVCALLADSAYARDFIVEFIEENYEETQAQFSYDPLIYHSIQIKSGAGPKILVLTGSDYNYRKWIRHFIAQEKKFITKIEDDRVDEFISSKAFEIDVTRLHPFNSMKWQPEEVEKKTGNQEIMGNNNILIVDPNKTRTRLITTVIKKMGYDAAVFSSAGKALEVFSLQPEKFKMVIVHYGIEDMAAEDFVSGVTMADHIIPVVIDVGYKKGEIADEMNARFAGSKSVHLKSVILRELPKTIQSLVKESV